MTSVQKYLAVGAAALIVLWGATKAHALGFQVEPPGFGPMSIQSGQTARLAVFCIDRNTLGLFPPGPCNVALSFNTIRGTVAGQSSLALSPGQSGYLDLPVGPSTEGNKFELVPAVIPSGAGHILATVEVFDTTTGRTVYFSNPGVPALSFLAGLGTGQ